MTHKGRCFRDRRKTKRRKAFQLAKLEATLRKGEKMLANMSAPMPTLESLGLLRRPRI